ncbi:hypothetical protein [Candidatus Poriferisocius sp.]|uniref:hypothetical protein n=1 Tax=Candidatus Poriferisocius sp. TaxID=3101276 RepID=UPI003B51FE85
MARQGARLVAIALKIAVCACSAHDTAACEDAAVGQTLAEQRWKEGFERHELAHDTLVENPDSGFDLGEHDHSAEELFSARVNMILAEAETRRQCG